MIRPIRLVVLSLLASVLAATVCPAQESAKAGRLVETDHLLLQWVDSPTPEEVELATAVSTKLYGRVAELLGQQHPEGKITIVFGGDAERPGRRREYPRVDWMGRVLLFKFIPDFDNHFTALAHELVHAFRFDRRGTADWFFEESFAEFVALRADPSLAGFPWFDAPITVVAGQWLAKGEDIPLSTLRERHREVNLPCRAQSYTLRSAFFDWLGRTFGDETVIRAAKETPAGALADYERFFGKPFEQLEQDWRRALLAEYRAIPEVDELAAKYRESPIKYMRVCAAGKDF